MPKDNSCFILSILWSSNRSKCFIKYHNTFAKDYKLQSRKPRLHDNFLYINRYNFLVVSLFPIIFLAISFSCFGCCFNMKLRSIQSAQATNVEYLLSVYCEGHIFHTPLLQDLQSWYSFFFFFTFLQQYAYEILTSSYLLQKSLNIADILCSGEIYNLLGAWLCR